MNLDDIKSNFDRDGFVHLPGVIHGAELDALRNETGRMIEEGWRGKTPSQHYFTARDEKSGAEVFHRVQFLFPKAQRQPNPFLALLGHPQLLSVVARLHAGFHFMLSGEALVFKVPGNGRVVPVHCDGAEWHPGVTARETFFNIDIYLDDSTLENGCLLAAPGSHLRPAGELIREKGFAFPGLVPVPVRAGDVIVHNTRLVHGSHESRAKSLRRTIYYEFRTLEWAVSEEHAALMGKPVAAMQEWARARTRLIQHGIDERAKAPFAPKETPFNYRRPDGWTSDPIKEADIDLAPSFGGSFF